MTASARPGCLPSSERIAPEFGHIDASQYSCVPKLRQI